MIGSKLPTSNCFWKSIVSTSKISNSGGALLMRKMTHKSSQRPFVKLPVARGIVLYNFLLLIPTQMPIPTRNTTILSLSLNFRILIPFAPTLRYSSCTTPHTTADDISRLMNDIQSCLRLKNPIASKSQDSWTDSPLVVHHTATKSKHHSH